MFETTGDHFFRARPAVLAAVAGLMVALSTGAARAEDVDFKPVLVPPPTHPLARSDAGAPAGALAVQQRSSGWWLSSTGIALLLAVCGAVCVAARKYRPQDASAPLRVVGRVNLSPRHAIFMVQAGDRVLLVGTGNQGPPSLLGELHDADSAAELVGTASAGARPDAPAQSPILASSYRGGRGLDVRLGEEE